MSGPRPAPRPATPLLAAVALVAVWAAAATAMAADRHAPASDRLARNRAAARADAARLLAEVSLPDGASRTGGGIRHPQALVATSAGVTDAVRWRVPDQTPQQVIADVQASPPDGVTSTSDQSSSAAGATTSVAVTFTLTPVPGTLSDRLVQVSAAPTGDGDSSVTVTSESVWLVPRTAASRVPATTRLITVSVMNHAGRTLKSATVTAHARVRAALRFLNGLEAVQPFTVNCPSDAETGDVITVDFLRARGDVPLAEATFDESSGSTSAECNPVALRVHGRAENGLLGGRYVLGLEHALGTGLPVSTE